MRHAIYVMSDGQFATAEYGEDIVLRINGIEPMILPVEELEAVKAAKEQHGKDAHFDKKSKKIVVKKPTKDDMITKE